MENCNIRIRDMRIDERPRNRLLDKGAGSLSDSELLSIILRTGSKKENAVNHPSLSDGAYSVRSKGN